MTERFIPDPDLLESPIGRHMPINRTHALALSDADLPNAVETLVLGAGAAGTTLATHLWHVPELDFLVLDSRSEFAEVFRQRIKGLGQAVLRSPYEHHVGAHNYRDCEMLDFGRSMWRYLTDTERAEIRRAQGGQRSVVPVDVFESFLGVSCAAHELSSRSRRARVTGIEAGSDGFLVSTDRGSEPVKGLLPVLVRFLFGRLAG